MDVDEVLQQVKSARFNSSWEGCAMWASGLVSWHLAQHATTWAPPEDLQESTQTLISHVSSVIACALHAVAVAHSMATADGARLLSIPLAPAAELLSAGRALPMLSSAAPPDSTVASLLRSVPVWIKAGDNAARRKGEFVIGRARDVLSVHAEYGDKVGDRIRAVLEVNYAVGDFR